MRPGGTSTGLAVAVWHRRRVDRGDDIVGPAETATPPVSLDRAAREKDRGEP
jgi:hypothetical protein